MEILSKSNRLKSELNGDSAELPLKQQRATAFHYLNMKLIQPLGMKLYKMLLAQADTR